MGLACPSRCCPWEGHHERDTLDRRAAHDRDALGRAGCDTASGAADRHEETAAVPSMDPNRAPVILSGAVIAEAALLVSGLDEALISERDSLDAVAEDLLTQA